MVLRRPTVKVNRWELDANGRRADGGPISLRSTAGTGRCRRGSSSVAHLTRIGRHRTADLFWCVLLTPHGPQDQQKRQNQQNTAADITRGVGRVAAVTPAGEGRWERGGGTVGRAGPGPARNSVSNWCPAANKACVFFFCGRKPRLKRGLLPAQRACNTENMTMMMLLMR